MNGISDKSASRRAFLRKTGSGTEIGFEKVVGEVANLEKPLGIYEFSQFTPPK